MPIIVKGLKEWPKKGMRPIGVTLTIHDNDIITIEKTDGFPKFTVLRGGLLGIQLDNDIFAEVEDSCELITFFLPQKYHQDILCPKGTFNRLKNEVFQM
jgi:hypothetical protein